MASIGQRIENEDSYRTSNTATPKNLIVCATANQREIKLPTAIGELPVGVNATDEYIIDSVYGVLTDYSGMVLPIAIAGDVDIKLSSAATPIAVGAKVFAAVGGKAIPAPAAAGTYYAVGVALSAATAADELCTVRLFQSPVAVVVT